MFFVVILLQDKLYWSLFTSYVQMQLCETDNPVEFFLEGTRSRSGKSLYPKFGLLQMCMEPFFRCQLYDLVGLICFLQENSESLWLFLVPNVLNRFAKLCSESFFLKVISFNWLFRLLFQLPSIMIRFWKNFCMLTNFLAFRNRKKRPQVNLLVGLLLGVFFECISYLLIYRTF